jgi:hypothetical protein
MTRHMVSVIVLLNQYFQWEAVFGPEATWKRLFPDVSFRRQTSEG